VGSTGGGQSGLLQRLRGATVSTKSGEPVPKLSFTSLPNLPTAPPLQIEKEIKLSSTPLSLVKTVAVKNPDISARFFAQVGLIEIC